MMESTEKYVQLLVVWLYDASRTSSLYAVDCALLIIGSAVSATASEVHEKHVRARDATSCVSVCIEVVCDARIYMHI